MTLSCEVELYWKDRLTMAKVLFFWNRYLPIVVLAANVYGPSVHTDKVRRYFVSWFRSPTTMFETEVMLTCSLKFFSQFSCD